MKNSNIAKFKKVGMNIKKYREDKNLTQKELCSLVGISLSYLTKIEAENCPKSFSLDLLFDISEALDIDIKKFF